MKISTTYFGPVSWYRKLAASNGTVCIDRNERFVKQTERSRFRIATANGVQTLSVPVSYNNGDLTCDVRIAEHSNWRHTHWQSLSSAYGSSPFFEYYADDIHPFFEKKWEFLYDYNMEIITTICDLIGIDVELKNDGVGEMLQNAVMNNDCINDANVKNAGIVMDDKTCVKDEECIPYYQTFQARHGFIPDLSVLDLLFNEGPESILYLLNMQREGL